MCKIKSHKFISKIANLNLSEDFTYVIACGDSED